MDIHTMMLLGSMEKNRQQGIDHAKDKQNARNIAGADKHNHVANIVDALTKKFQERIQNMEERELKLQHEVKRLGVVIDEMQNVVDTKDMLLSKANKMFNEYDEKIDDLKNQKNQNPQDIFRSMLENKSLLDVAQDSEVIVREIAEERVTLNKWILSRNSYWELAYRICKENGINLSMEEIKEKADAIRVELLKQGFTDDEMNEDWLNSNMLSKLTTEGQVGLIKEEIEEHKEISEVKNQELLALDAEKEKLLEEIAEIDRSLETLSSNNSGVNDNKLKVN